MAAVLVFAVLVLFTPTVADIYMTQESDKCSRIDLTSCSNHHLRCPNEGPPSVIALSQAKNGFRRSAVFSFCSYQFSCAAQSTCCVRSYFRFCYEDVSDDHLMDLAYACLIESSCEFRVPVVQANSSNCRSPAFDSDQSLMSTIQYFCIPKSTILDTRMDFQSLSETQGASILVTKSDGSEQDSGLSRTTTCNMWSPVGQNNTISLFQYAFINGTKSRNWYVRIEDSKKSVVVFSPFHNRTEVLAKKRMSGLLTPVTIHLRVENAGAPSLLWIGFEVEDYTKSFHLTCSSTSDSSSTGEDMNPWQNSSAVDGNITDHKPSSADDGGNSSFPTPAASDALRSKDSLSTIYLIVGAVVGAILVVVLAAVLLYIVCRRHQDKSRGKARSRATVPSSTSLDDYGYCIPVVSGNTVTSPTDSSTDDVLVDGKKITLSPQQQRMTWQHSTIEDGSASDAATPSSSSAAAIAEAAAAPKTTTEDEAVEVYANIFHNYAFAGDVEFTTDDDSFTSEFDVCTSDPNMYENNIVEENSAGDCSELVKEILAHDYEPIYQELNLERVDYQNTDKLRLQESIRFEGQDSGFLNPIHDVKFSSFISSPGASHIASTLRGEEEPACLTGFANTQLDDSTGAPRWPSRESSLYNLGHAPSPPFTSPSESQTPRTKRRHGVSDVKKRLRQLFAKKECYTPGHQVPKEVTSIVACGEDLDGALRGAQPPLTVSATDDRDTVADDDYADLAQYSTVTKCKGFLCEQEPMDGVQSTSRKPGRRQKKGDSAKLGGSAPEIISKKKNLLDIKGTKTAGQR